MSKLSDELGDLMRAEAAGVNRDWEKPINPIPDHLKDKQIVLNGPDNKEVVPNKEVLEALKQKPNDAPVKILGFNA
jgi:hypothetical protein